MKKEFFDAVWTFVAITIGAGIFGLPYVFFKAGFFTGLVVIIVASLIMLIISLYLGEIILRTKGKHQLSGLAERYFGNKGKTIMFIAEILSIYGALAAYIVGSGQALAAVFGGNTLIYSILFFIVVAAVIFFSINIIENFEAVFSPIKILLALILSFLLLRFFDFGNISGFSFGSLLVPYGVSIFAFAGLSALPEMNEELKNKKYMFSAIVVGMIITFIVYLIFIFSVLGSLTEVNEVATISLSQFGFGVNLFANLFTLFALATAFVALGFALKENFTLDYKLPNFGSWLLTIIVPLLLVFLGFGFVKLIELSGAVALGVILVMILLMHSKAKKIGDRKPEYEFKDNKTLKFILFLVLIIGIVYSVLSFL